MFNPSMFTPSYQPTPMRGRPFGPGMNTPPMMGRNMMRNAAAFGPGSALRSRVPLSIPKGGGLLSKILPGLGGATATAGGTRLTLSKVLSGTENVIATVNQVIPIYQQVKPLWDNSKVLKNAFKKVFPGKASTTSSASREVINDPEIVTPPPKAEPKKAPQNDFKDQEEPNRPFF